MALHFSKQLELDTINSIAKKFGFAVASNVEKFIMDFEMQYQIIQNMTCITRGGMCMPFHVEEGTRRLSIDIDLLTENTVDETKLIMENINDKLVEVNIEPIIPQNPYPLQNLVSFTVSYDSCFGTPDFIKVDFLCNIKISLPSNIIKPGFDLFAFTTDYDMSILSRGALIGDKLTTLSLDKIGLPARHYAEIPKQVYDIATLLKSVEKNDLRESLETFQSFTNYKVKEYHSTPAYIIDDIVIGINESLDGLIETISTINLSDVEESRYNTFKNRFLGDSMQQYRKNEHISDILLVRLFNKYVSRFLKSELSLTDCIKSIHEKILEFKEIQEYDADAKSTKRQELIATFPTSIKFNKNILNGPPVEHVFLLREINN